MGKYSYLDVWKQATSGKTELQPKQNALGERVFADYALPGNQTTRQIIRDAQNAARQQALSEAVVLTSWCDTTNTDLDTCVQVWVRTRRLRGDVWQVYCEDLGIKDADRANRLVERALEIQMRPATAMAEVVGWTPILGDADQAVLVMTTYVTVKAAAGRQLPLDAELGALAQADDVDVDVLWELIGKVFLLDEDGILDRLRNHAAQTSQPIANLLVLVEERAEATKSEPSAYAESIIAEAQEQQRRAQALQNFAASGATQREEAKKVTVLELEAAIAELDNLIGLQEAKDAVRRFLAVMEVSKARGGSTAPAMNIVFIGGPGTGKTTVARLLGRLLAGAGLLASGHVVETDPGGMKGSYIGQTAPRVTALFDSAKSGILFIDEIYGLSDSQDAFGKEATDVLLKLAEDRRGQQAVVIAGYSAETQRFLDSNPGLQSRFNTVVRFADYTPTEMLQVIHVMAQKQSYSLAAGCDEILNGYFARRPQGNGRLCRNVLEAATQ